MKEITVIRAGHGSEKVKLYDDATLENAIEAIGEEVEDGYTITVNGDYPDFNRVLEEGDRVILTPKVKAG